MTPRPRRARLRVDVLADLRERAHLTVPQLAAATGISRSHLSNVEHGTRSMSITDLAILAAHYDVPIDSLVELTPTPGTHAERSNDTSTTDHTAVAS